MHAHLELFPINPAMLAKYREAAKAASGPRTTRSMPPCWVS